MTVSAAGRGRRWCAALAVIGVALPLAALPGGPAAAAPTGRIAAAPDDSCSTDTPKLINQRPPGLLQLGAEAANTVATGQGVTVAIVDSGVDARNVHLRGGTVEPGRDLTGQAPNGQTDLQGHGTAIAGEIAAQRVTGSQVVGLAPDAKILPIRVYTLDDTSNPGGVDQNGKKIIPPSVDGIANGIQAAAAAGAQIINVSMSTSVPSDALAKAVAYATSKGSLVIASAGNRQTSDDKSNDPRYPAAYPDVLAVSAVDGNGAVTDDSIHGSYVDVAAPGTDILTTYFYAGDCQLAVQNASTSYATGYVSAAAALIAQAHPDETPAQWRYRLEVTALRVRPDTRDDNAGWGVIQPYEALTFVADGTAAGPQDPVVRPSAAPSAVAQQVDPVVRRPVDHTTRDQTLWLVLGGVVVVLALALVALLRRDRRRRPTPVSPPRTPAGVR